MRFRPIIALTGAIFLALPASPVSAHTVLVNSTPQGESVISSLPPDITISFAEDLIDIGNSNAIKVLDEAGLDVSQGEVLVSGPTISKALIPSDKKGIFKVEYRAVASDGHVIEGSYSFTLQPFIEGTSEGTSAEQKNENSENKSGLSTFLLIMSTVVAGSALALFLTRKTEPK